jgi:methionine-gamma-lyase
MSCRKNDHDATRPIHAGPLPEASCGAVSMPIYQTSTFAFHDAAEGAARFEGLDGGYKYTRLGNPTNRALETAVQELEGGYDALATATGMAAISTVLLALLRAGDHIVGTDCVYGPTRLLVEKHLSKFGIVSSWVPTEDLDAVRAAVRPETRLIFVETPANPTMKLTDLEGCARIARDRDAWFVVDNTFCSPVLQQPLRHGAHVVVHSMTKYINGHSDVVAGMIVSGHADVHEKLRASLCTLGGTIDPHQAWLVLRGMRTLDLRIRAAQDNAVRLAEWLRAHPKVAWVSYPGLPEHPQHDLVAKQMKGPGAMIAFGVRGGLEAARRMIDAVRLATLAVSLGGVETLIEHPASMTHAGVSREERERSGIRDDLVRLSVGCEAYEDLRDDLDQALAASDVEVRDEEPRQLETV